MAGLDRRGEDPAEPDAVAAHDDRALPLVLVRDGEAHGVGVLRAQLEDVTDLDAADRGEGAAGGGRGGVAVACVADVGDDDPVTGSLPEGLEKLSVPVEVPDVMVDLVGACNPEALALRRVAIDEHEGLVGSPQQGVRADVAHREAVLPGRRLRGEVHREHPGLDAVHGGPEL